MKQIRFNTDMVRAILSGIQTTTRRVVKPQPENAHTILGPGEEDGTFEFLCGCIRDGACPDWIEAVKMPYQPGDILYVRETWQAVYENEYDEKAPGGCVNIRTRIPNFDAIEKVEAGISSEFSCTAMKPRMKYYVFKASDIECANPENGLRWRPSIHMPREAARIFLRVTDVRVERIQDISPMGIRMEGIKIPQSDEWDCEMSPDVMRRFEFARLWDSTIPKHPNKFKRYPYYWEDDPWVWVIDFQRIKREESLGTWNRRTENGN